MSSFGKVISCGAPRRTRTNNNAVKHCCHKLMISCRLSCNGVRSKINSQPWHLQIIAFSGLKQHPLNKVKFLDFEQFLPSGKSVIALARF
jgi:hypothetical protein